MPTHFEVAEGSVRQVIKHDDSFTYPIVADPYLGRKLIQAAHWTWEPRTASFGAGWTLRVTATAWAWEMSASPVADLSAAAAKYGWEELKSFYSLGFPAVRNGKWSVKKLDRHLNAMWHQYLCHAEYAATYYGSKRPTWNLDEWRLDVGYLATVRYRCNPPAGGPYRY